MSTAVSWHAVSLNMGTLGLVLACDWHQRSSTTLLWLAPDGVALVRRPTREETAEEFTLATRASSHSAHGWKNGKQCAAKLLKSRGTG